jgi:hypothetical protein
MEELFKAPCNNYSYISFFLPVLVMLAGGYFQKKSIFIACILFSLVSTYYICQLSIQERWKVDEALAIANNDTSIDFESEEITTRAFYIASIESVLYTAVWSVVGWRLWPLLRRNHLSEKLPELN